MGFLYCRNGFHYMLLASKFVRNMILHSAKVSEHNKRGTIFLLCEEPIRIGSDWFKKHFIILVMGVVPSICEVTFVFRRFRICRIPCWFSTLQGRWVSGVNIILISIQPSVIHPKSHRVFLWNKGRDQVSWCLFEISYTGWDKSRLAVIRMKNNIILNK